MAGGDAGGTKLQCEGVRVRERPQRLLAGCDKGVIASVCGQGVRRGGVVGQLLSVPGVLLADEGGAEVVAAGDAGLERGALEASPVGWARHFLGDLVVRRSLGGVGDDFSRGSSP